MTVPRPGADGDGTDPGGDTPDAEVPAWARVLFFAVLASWLLFPFVLRDRNEATDLLPYVVEGEQVGVAPDRIYPASGDDAFATDPAVTARSCELLGLDPACRANTFPPVSPPVVLPLAAGLAHLGFADASALVRLLGAACFAGGMLVLWTDLTRLTARAGPVLAVTAVVMTRVVFDPLLIGQTSPLLFLGAALAPGRWRRGPAQVASVAVWALTSVFKAFPLLLVALVAHRRWWRQLGLYLGILAGLALVTSALVPVTVWADYVGFARSFSQAVLGISGNLNVQALVHLLWPEQPPAVDLAVQLAVLGGLGALWWRKVRFAPPAAEWAWVWMGAMVAMPVVWGHYAVTGLVPVAFALAARREAGGRIDGALWLLPGLAVATAVLQAWLERVHVRFRDVTILITVVPGLVLVFGSLAVAYRLLPARPAADVGDVQPSAVEGSQPGRPAS